MAVAVAIVIGLVEGIKRLNLFETKWLFLVDVVFGLGAGYLMVGNNPREIIIQGLIIGLSAAGLFSGIKNTFEEKTRVEKYEDID